MSSQGVRDFTPKKGLGDMTAPYPVIMPNFYLGVSNGFGRSQRLMRTHGPTFAEHNAIIFGVMAALESVEKD